jgi:MFS family permease
VTGASAAFLAVAVAMLSWPVTLAAVALLGSASGSLEPLLTTQTLSNQTAAAKLGATRSMGSLGWVLGLGLGGSVVSLSSHSPFAFLVAGVAALTAPTAGPRAAAHRVNPTAETEAGPTAELEPRAATVSPRPPLREVLGVLSVTFPYILGTATMVYFTGGWAHRSLGTGPLLSVAPLALSAALEIPAFVLVDRLASRLTPRLLAGSAYLPFGLACLGLTLHPTRGMLFGVQTLVALSFALWFVGQSRLTAERVDRAQLASALTLVSTLGRGVAGPLSGIVGGVLASAGGYRWLFAAMVILSVVGLVRALAMRTGSDRRARKKA